MVFKKFVFQPKTFHSSMCIIVFSGSQVNATQQPLRGQEVMRKSGDWSYVSFPNSKSPPLTPKMTPKRPLSMLPQTSVSNFPPKTGNLAGNLNQHLHQHQPISLLESKVMASIIHNEATRSQKASPAGILSLSLFIWLKYFNLGIVLTTLLIA